MWSVIVVVHAPSLEHGAGMWQGPKQRFVEHFVPEPADEGFGGLQTITNRKLN
jgi:hypothetical protein